MNILDLLNPKIPQLNGYKHPLSDNPFSVIFGGEEPINDDLPSLKNQLAQMASKDIPRKSALPQATGTQDIDALKNDIAKASVTQNQPQQEVSVKDKLMELLSNYDKPETPYKPTDLGDVVGSIGNIFTGKEGIPSGLLGALQKLGSYAGTGQGLSLIGAATHRDPILNAGLQKLGEENRLADDQNKIGMERDQQKLSILKELGNIDPNLHPKEIYEGITYKDKYGVPRRGSHNKVTNEYLTSQNDLEIPKGYEQITDPQSGKKLLLNTLTGGTFDAGLPGKQPVSDVGNLGPVVENKFDAAKKEVSTQPAYTAAADGIRRSRAVDAMIGQKTSIGDIVTKFQALAGLAGETGRAVTDKKLAQFGGSPDLKSAAIRAYNKRVNGIAFTEKDRGDLQALNQIQRSLLQDQLDSLIEAKAQELSEGTKIDKKAIVKGLRSQYGDIYKNEPVKKSSTTNKPKKDPMGLFK